MCKLYLIECFEFEQANTSGKQKTIACHCRNVVYYVKCMNFLHITFKKSIRNYIMISKHKNIHNTESKYGMSWCNFPNYVFNCGGRKNRKLKEPFSKYMSCSL